MFLLFCLYYLHTKIIELDLLSIQIKIVTAIVINIHVLVLQNINKIIKKNNYIS